MYIQITVILEISHMSTDGCLPDDLLPWVKKTSALQKKTGIIY